MSSSATKFSDAQEPEASPSQPQAVPVNYEYSLHLRCGLAIVNLATDQIVGSFWFNSGVEKVFAVSVLPGYRNPVLIEPDTDLDGTQSVWMVPSLGA